jgi:hypothetical protein
MTAKIRTLYYILAVILFLICAFLVVTYAAGYKIDIKQRKMSQTGIISVQTDGGQIYINGKFEGTDEVTLRNLVSGKYLVEVKKDGYHPWSKSFELAPGEAKILDNVVLFKENPKVEEYKIETSDFFQKLADTDNLQVNGGEIYQNGNFITRFEKDVFGASWYPDRKYISFTYEGKLRIMEIDGSNNIEIATKNSTSPAVFVNSGRTAIYENDGKIYRAEIR